MSAPALTAFVDGQTAPVTADNLNTFVQSCDNTSQLRAFIGVTGNQVYLRGIDAPGDGGQGIFYWNGSASGPDNNSSIIVPTGAAAGAWIRLSSDGLNLADYTYNVPVTGFSIALGNAVTSLILNPAGTLSTGTITLPASPIDGQLVRISSTQIVTTLTLTVVGGQTLKNAITTLAAGTGGATYQYVASIATWFRV